MSRKDRPQHSVRHPVIGPIVTCFLLAATLVVGVGLVRQMAAGDLDTNDKLASVASFVVGCAALLLSAVSLRVQLHDRAQSRRSEARANLGRRLTALHVAAGRPDWRKLRALKHDSDSPLPRLTNRDFKAVLAGDSASWSTTSAIIGAVLAFTSVHGRIVEAELQDLRNWRKWWTAADTGSAPRLSRRRSVGLAITAAIAVVLVPVLDPGSPEVTPAEAAEHLVVGKGVRHTSKEAVEEVRLRVALANPADDDRTIKSIRVYGQTSPGKCGSHGQFVRYTVSTKLTVTTLEHRTMNFTGEVVESTAEYADAPPPTDDAAMRLPAEGSLMGATCDGMLFHLGFDVVLVLPAHATTMVEIRLPERLDASVQRKPGRVVAQTLQFPGFNAVVAIDSEGREIRACRGTVPDLQVFSMVREARMCENGT